jgi:hypothetical protein
MKRILFFLNALLISFHSIAQIPNAGFETWISAGSFEDALDWTSFNQYTQFASVTTVSKTNDAHSGTFAARTETISFFNSLTGTQDTVPGIMITGTDILSPVTGFPFSFRPDSMSAWFKYAPAGADFAGIGVILSKWNSSSGARDYIASGEISIFSAAANYTYDSAPLSYFMPDVPDTAFIYISSSNGSIAFPGSVLIVDDISFVTLVGIEKIKSNSFDAVAFPNPANENIRFHLPYASEYLITIFDVTGKQIKTFCSHGNYFLDADVSAYESGLYLFTISETQGNNRKSGKFFVTK